MAKRLRSGEIAVRRGTIVARRKAGVLNEERKRQYRLIALKTKMQKKLSAPGARVYSLVSANDKKNLAADSIVKDITAHIKWYEAEIALLERKQGKAVRRRIEEPRKILPSTAHLKMHHLFHLRGCRGQYAFGTLSFLHPRAEIEAQNPILGMYTLLVMMNIGKRSELHGLNGSWREPLPCQYGRTKMSRNIYCRRHPTCSGYA
ncbi:MAG TPA: hypothetical protein VEM40_00020 [Nitrospirota bacterium]|nr:hypothetical protein [Nitrospirota bacterium]